MLRCTRDAEGVLRTEVDEGIWRNENRTIFISLSVYLPVGFGSLPPAADVGPDAGHQIEVSAADEHSGGESWLCTVGGHPENIQFRLGD